MITKYTYAIYCIDLPSSLFELILNILYLRSVPTGCGWICASDVENYISLVIFFLAFWPAPYASSKYSSGFHKNAKTSVFTDTIRLSVYSEET